MGGFDNISYDYENWSKAMTTDKYFWKSNGNCKVLKELGLIVPDIKEYARKHHEMFGSGPFILGDELKFKVIHKGEESFISFYICHGLWDSMAIELCQQTSDNDTYFTDFNDLEKPGVNHYHMVVENVGEALKEFTDRGYEANTVCEFNGQTFFAFIDMFEDFGYMLEIYSNQFASTTERAFKVGENWDGTGDLFFKVDKETGELIGLGR